MTNENDFSPAANVARGVQFLEHAVGADWRKYIDLDTFDIVDTEQCVIGQTFCHELVRSRNAASVLHSPTAWTAGEWALADFDDAEGLRDGTVAEQYVACVAYGFEQDSSEAPYHELQAEWVRVIQSV